METHTHTHTRTHSGLVQLRKPPLSDPGSVNFSTWACGWSVTYEDQKNYHIWKCCWRQQERPSAPFCERAHSSINQYTHNPQKTADYFTKS